MSRYKRDKVIVTCGSYDPLTVDDIDFLKRCKSKGDWLVVGIHSDWWMLYARGGMVHKYEERREIISNLKMDEQPYC